MAISFFKNRWLEQYRLHLIDKILNRHPLGPILKNDYLPQRLIKYAPLIPTLDGVYRRKLYFLPQLQVGEKLWIIGGPESGKTALMLKIALRLAFCDDCHRVPVYIKLPHLIQKKQNLPEHICSLFEEGGFCDPAKFVTQNLEEGKLVLLIDGIDEIASPILIQGVTDTLRGFLNEYGKGENTLLIASRSARYCSLLQGTEKAFVQELNERQVKKLIEKKIVWPASPHRLLKRLQQDRELKRLARSPFALSVLCRFYRPERPLPVNRAQIYQTFVCHALQTAPQPFEQNTCGAEQKRQILEETAFNTHKQKLVFFTEGTFCATAQRVFSQAGMVLGDGRALLRESSVFKELLTLYCAPDCYGFSHLAVQEFLSACKLSRMEGGVEFILERHSDPWWEETIAFYSGLLENSSELIHKLRDVNNHLALKCFIEAANVDASLKKSMQRLIRQNIDQDRGEMRHLEALHQAIIAKADGHTVNLIKRNIHNRPESWLKVKYAQLLCEIGDGRSLDALEEGLTNGSDPETKKCIITAFDYLWNTYQPLPYNFCDARLLETAKEALPFIEASDITKHTPDTP